MRESLLVLFLVSLLVAACATVEPVQLQVNFAQVQAYIAGRVSASRGDPVDSNPYHGRNPDNLFREWESGWTAGQQQPVNEGPVPGDDIEWLGW
ncbi:MAG: hypothetical protein GY903_26665 [Fuerstiella sp.]|nr:hypothetical protein [Fuerstiella sp.]MCP4858081.1 hypothetical protein [Fuerstiella sp.]